MKSFFSKKNKAFTLMEIGLSLLIISILIIVCIPVVVHQAKKTDEYAYFMAYKTVEKMGAQIVAFGDPEESTSQGNENVTGYNTENLNIKKYKNYVCSYADKLLKTIYPKAEAAVDTSVILSFPRYEYDYVRLCLGDPNVERNDIKKEVGDYAGHTYSLAEIQAIQQEEFCQSLRNDLSYDFIKKRFMCPNMTNVSEVLNILRGTDGENSIEMDAETYCTQFLPARCSGVYDCSNNEYSCYKKIQYGQDSGRYNYDVCNIKIMDPDMDYERQVPNDTSDSTLSYALDCNNFGFVNMSGIPCSCGAGYSKALNNSGVCCTDSIQANQYPYYKDAQTPCVYCNLGAFNELEKSCCPEHSIYSQSLQKCVCDEGYVSSNGDNGVVCNAITNNICAAGTHLKDGVCVINTPVVKAKRFCELVAHNWNISKANCDTFTLDGGITYNSDLYNAITAENTPYLSTIGVEGAFNNIEPNIVFSNGLMMWILGDKSASIPGLSFNPDIYSPKVNACKLNSSLNKNTCTSGTNYFCQNDDKCFSIDSGAVQGEESTVSVQRLKDARTCCSSADFSDLISKYEGSDYLRDPRVYAISGFTVFIDINGTKDNDELGGGGTLWKDVFPFFITANGKAYPGYPLNAAKANSSSKDSSSLYQGGNSSALSADVFYYAVVNGKRRKIVAYPSVPYARALCFSLEVSGYSPYCQNLGSKYRINTSKTRLDEYIYSDDNPCYRHTCFVKLKNKIKYL